MADIHLAIPPNILRKTADDLKVKFPDITIRPHQTHSEMAAFFADDFGDPEKTADLTLAAYPSALANCMTQKEGGIFQAMPHDLPALCPYLAGAGFGESTPFYRVVAVVTLVFIANRQVDPFPKSWRDLCGQALRDRVVIPPEETPAPALYAYYMEKFFQETGRRASRAVHQNLLPQQINVAVDLGRYAAGMVFPAFARTFRSGNAAMVWPEEGALTLPLLAFLKKGAPAAAKGVLAFVMGHEYQSFLSSSGLFCPIREDVPKFEELEDENNRLNWMGWPDYCAMAQFNAYK